jgi:hypothetical protein
MNTHFNFKASLLMTALLGISAAQATVISKPEFTSGKTRISADYAAAKAACKSHAGNARDICMEEAKGKEKVARAELQYAYTAKPGDLTKAEEAKAKATYEVAKERCDDLAGNDKSVCVKEAKSVEVKALVNARMAGKIGETRKDGAQEKMDADYKVAAEKCEVLAGDAKASCMASAKAKFGKS